MWGDIASWFDNRYIIIIFFVSSKMEGVFDGIRPSLRIVRTYLVPDWSAAYLGQSGATFLVRSKKLQEALGTI